MEIISLSGRRAPGFGVGDQPVSGVVSPVYAALMTGAAASLLTYVLQAPAWGAVLVGTGVAVATKVGIDKAAA